MSHIVNDAINQAQRLFFPEQATPPVVQLPKDTICDPLSLDYSVEENSVPMAFVSLTNVALQYIFNLRDFILSCDDQSITRETKCALVSALSVTTAIGYTYLTLQEASLRVLAFLIVSLVVVPFMFLGLVISIITNDTTIGKHVIYADFVLVVGLCTSLQCVAQIGTGFFAAHHMMTSKDANLPKVLTVVSEATFGLPDFAVKITKSILYEITH